MNDTLSFFLLLLFLLCVKVLFTRIAIYFYAYFNFLLQYKGQLLTSYILCRLTHT